MEQQKPKRGRPSKASAAVKAEICDRLSKGETERSIRDSLGIAHGTIVLWRQNDKAFNDSIARARDAGFDAIADECLAIADDARDDPNSRRIRVDTRLRLLAKWCSGRYGDKLEVQGNAGAVVVIKIGGTVRDEVPLIEDANG